MMIRKYVVKDIPEAVVMIRRELGKDAVILNTRKVWAKRFGGLWRSKRVEVVAATGDDVPRRAVAGEVPSSLRVDGPSPTASSAVQMTTTSVPAGQQMISSATSTLTAGATETATAVATEALEKPTLGADHTKDTEASQEVRRLWAELSELKQKLNTTNVEQDLGTGKSSTSGNTSFSRLRHHLLNQGVQQHHVDRLIEECERTSAETDPSLSENQLSFEAVRQIFLGVALQAVGNLADPRPLGTDARVVGMVGPTGVGKTTTIAKLAALHVLEGKRKVGLLTTDTFRIAAVDQLRTYANILNIPLQVVYQESEIESALHALADRDLILVDTAGRNFSNTKHVHETHHLLDTLACDEVHLVLSLTSKSEDLTELANSFQELPVSQVILTKLDETRSYGGALNLLLDFKRPFSYITMGQNVPDDISVASTEKLLRLTAGGARF